MPKKKGVGKRKVQETPEEKQMRLEMEELKVRGYNPNDLKSIAAYACK
jgi:hypothetical protein